MAYRKRTFPIFPDVRSCYPTGHGKGEQDTLRFLKVTMHSSIREKTPDSTPEVDKEMIWKKSPFNSHFCQFLCLGFSTQL